MDHSVNGLSAQPHAALVFRLENNNIHAGSETTSNNETAPSHQQATANGRTGELVLLHAAEVFNLDNESTTAVLHQKEKQENVTQTHVLTGEVGPTMVHAQSHAVLADKPEPDCA